MIENYKKMKQNEEMLRSLKHNNSASISEQSAEGYDCPLFEIK